MERRERLDELHLELKRLKRFFEELGASLIEQGEKLKFPGCPPDPFLLEKLSQGVQDYQTFVEELEKFAGNGDASTELKREASLEKLEEILRELKKQPFSASFLEEEREKALSVVDKALRAKLPGEIDREEKSRFFEKLRGYRDVLVQGKGEEVTILTCQLLEGKHPLNAFIRLVEEDPGLRETEVLFQAAAGEFGTLISLAAARKRVVFYRKNEKNNLLSAQEDRMEKPGFNVALAEEEKNDLLDRFPSLLSTLLLEEKLAAAYWLACYWEHLSGAPPLPSWLIKTVELAGVIYGEDGPAAKWLEYFYSNFDWESLLSLESNIPGENLLIAFFSFASLIRPALVAPKTGAFKLAQKLIQGGRLPSKMGKVCHLCLEVLPGKPAIEEGPKKMKKLKSLGEEARRWQERNQKLSLASSPALNLWSRMQEKGGLLYRLIQPVIENDTALLEEVSKSVNYLKDEENLKEELGILYRKMQDMGPSLGIFYIPGSWQIMVRLQEAVGIAERWVKLHGEGNKVEEGKTVDTRQLLDQVQEARGELEGIRGQYKENTLLAAGVQFSLRSLDFIESMAQGNSKLPRDPEEIAALEIGENPLVRFKPKHKCEAKTIERLGKSLLELIDDLENTSREKKKWEEHLHDEKQGASVDYKKIFSQDSISLKELLGDELLSQEEKEFIKDSLKNLSGGARLSEEEEG